MCLTRMNYYLYELNMKSQSLQKLVILRKIKRQRHKSSKETMKQEKQFRLGLNSEPKFIFHQRSMK